VLLFGVLGAVVHRALELIALELIALELIALELRAQEHIALRTEAQTD